MRFLLLQSHQRDTWPGQNRWSWMCCSSPKVRGLSLWRPKKPLWRCRSAQISQAKRWLLRQKKGWSRTPPDTFPPERWAPCHSGPCIALCHIPGERREPAWLRVRDRLLAPWSEQESCANWSNQQPLGGLMWLYHLVQTNLSLFLSHLLAYSPSHTLLFFSSMRISLRCLEYLRNVSWMIKKTKNQNKKYFQSNNSPRITIYQ